MPSRPTLQLPAFLGILTAGLWVIAVAAWIGRFGRVLGPEPFRSWLLDWHVYAAGGQEFLARTLYHVPLESPYNIPVSSFNLPPAAAATVLPFLVFPDDVGGTLWVLLNIVAVGAAAVLTTHILRLRYPWLWAGAIFCPLLHLPIGGFRPCSATTRRWCCSWLPASWPSISPIGRWPVACCWASPSRPSYGPPPSSWSWRGSGTGGPSAGRPARPRPSRSVLILWLGGLGVIGPMVAALQVRDEIGPDRFVLGITWLRENISWWPDWGGYAISLLILLIPAKGMTGYGLATLAGMAAIPNLWRHYWATVIFGALLLGRGLLDRRQAPRGKTPHARRVDAPARASETRRRPRVRFLDSAALRRPSRGWSACWWLSW